MEKADRDVFLMAIFGTTCFAFVQNKTKLDPRSEKGIFIGYDNESPAYQGYFKESGTVRKVRCVQFTKRFDDITAIEANVNVDDSEYFECRSDSERKPEVNGENNQHVPVVTGTSVSQKKMMLVLKCSFQVLQVMTAPERSTSKPKYLKDYVLKDDSINVTMHYCYKMCDMPVMYSEAISSPDSQNWKCAMKEEMDSLLNNDTFELTCLPEGHKVVGGRGVSAAKLGPNNEEQFKARYVAKGYSQVQDIIMKHFLQLLMSHQYVC